MRSTAPTLLAGQLDAADYEVGGRAVLTITLQNSGPDRAINPRLQVTLPTGTGFVTVDHPVGCSCTNPAVGSAATLSCSAASLADGATASFEVRLEAGVSSSRFQHDRCPPQRVFIVYVAR
jgi:uncharacterized repeat protein (TIGR01451 family)